jgi:hypothetical protein
MMFQVVVSAANPALAVGGALAGRRNENDSLRFWAPLMRGRLCNFVTRFGGAPELFACSDPKGIADEAALMTGAFRVYLRGRLNFLTLNDRADGVDGDIS